MTTKYPMSRICEALDLLQEHEVLGDNTADHNLGCWLEERGLTCDDLNAEPARATDTQQQAFTNLVRASFESNPDGAYEVIAGLITHNFEAEATADLIAEYTETMGLN